MAVCRFVWLHHLAPAEIWRLYNNSIPFDPASPVLANLPSLEERAERPTQCRGWKGFPLFNTAKTSGHQVQRREVIQVRGQRLRRVEKRTWLLFRWLFASSIYIYASALPWPCCRIPPASGRGAQRTSGVSAATGSTRTPCGQPLRVYSLLTAVLIRPPHACEIIISRTDASCRFVCSSKCWQNQSPNTKKCQNYEQKAAKQVFCLPSSYLTSVTGEYAKMATNYSLTWSI